VWTAIATSSSTAEGADRRAQRGQPVDGRRLQLTVDYDLQRALEDAFHAGNYNGAAILDPSTGGSSR
jgi:cell division protein FtsI/penicillin-binding protein 2